MGEDDDAAVEAFTQLKTEVALLRRAIEGLAAAEERPVGPDYSPTLGKMTIQLEELTQAVSILAPLRTFSPSRLTAEISAATSGVRHQAQRELSETQRGLDEALRVLSDVVARPRNRRAQQWWILAAFLSGALVGILSWASLFR